MLYSPLYTTASLPMMLGPKARALSYLVPTKYLFLPYSQTQSSEIPFFCDSKCSCLGKLGTEKKGCSSVPDVE